MLGGKSFAVVQPGLESRHSASRRGERGAVDLGGGTKKRCRAGARREREVGSVCTEAGGALCRADVPGENSGKVTIANNECNGNLYLSALPIFTYNPRLLL